MHHLLRGRKESSTPNAPPPAQQQPPPQPPSASQAAAELLSRLPRQHQFALGGLIAALLGPKSSYWGDTFCRQLLRRAALSMLRLPAEQMEALLPIYEHQNAEAASALVSLLPAEEHERAALLLALLALTILCEDVQQASEGYDARSRQLLVEAADTLGVPWQRMAEMERQLADSMRAQAASLAAQQESAASKGASGAPGAPGAPPGDEDATAGAGASDKKTFISAKWRKRIAVTTIGIASGIAVGATAGLAAPAVLAGLGAVGTGIGGMTALGGVGTAVGASIVGITAVLQGAIGVTVVTTLFGATGAGLASLKLNRRLGDVQEFEFAQPPSAAERRARRMSEDAKGAAAVGALYAKGDDTSTGGAAAAAAGAAAGAAADKEADEDAEAAVDGTDGLVVVVCVSGWLVGDTDTPQQHWWGDVAEVPFDEGEGEEGKDGTAAAPASAAAPAPAASGWPVRPSWPSPMPSLPPTPSDLAEQEKPPLRPPPPPPPTAAELEACRQEEMVSWLVEMGFPAAAAREAAPRHVCVEEVVEELLSHGIQPSLAAAGEDEGELAALRRMSVGAKVASKQLEPPPPPPPPAAAATAAGPSLPFAAAATAPSSAGAAAPATASSSASAEVLGGDSEEGEGEGALGLGATSFVQIDEAPARCALECVPHAEHHVLLWESKELRVLGNALGRIAASEALALTASTALKHTFLASLMAACATPAFLIKACDVLDNPWAIGFARAQKAGALLAQVLLERAHGKRPVILIGFGLGARLIFDCLLALAEALEGGDARAAGVIQHVVLMGLPATADPEVWQRLRLVAAGRLVNCYRPHDLVLAMVHRAANLTLGVAGLAEVECDGVENYDVSGIVHAHHKYRHQTGAVLDLVGLEQCERATAAASTTSEDEPSAASEGAGAPPP